MKLKEVVSRMKRSDGSLMGDPAGWTRLDPDGSRYSGIFMSPDQMWLAHRGRFEDPKSGEKKIRFKLYNRERIDSDDWVLMTDPLDESKNPAPSIFTAQDIRTIMGT